MDNDFSWDDFFNATNNAIIVGANQVRTTARQIERVTQQVRSINRPRNSLEQFFDQFTLQEKTFLFIGVVGILIGLKK
jgi:hypothetical protein